MRKMFSNARIRSVASAALMLVVAAVLLQICSAFIVLPRFRDIERKALDINVKRAGDAVFREVEAVGTISKDWSSWDDTYAFMQTKSQTYITSNLNNATLNNLGVDYILYFNKDNELTYGAARDALQQSQLPQDLLTVFGRGGALLPNQQSGGREGLLALGHKTYIYASQPILTSEGSGPARGSIVFARIFDDAMQTKISDATQLKLSFYSNGAGNLPLDVQEIAPILQDGMTTTRLLSSNTIAGYSALRDSQGKVALLIKNERDRTLYAGAMRSLNYFALAALSIFFLLSLINGAVISRLLNKQKTIELKDEFFSMASHELRTPLTAIRGNSQMISQMYARDNKDLAEMSQDIHASSERLIRIVNNFLDAARLEQGKIPFKLEPFSLSGVVDAVTAELQGIAVEKKIIIRSSLPKQLPPVFADKDRVKQVIYNLVGNAVKYTDTGSITLSVYPENKFIVVSIQDTGRGIPKSAQSALFDKFQQVKSTDVDKGSGLGLYITKMLVAQMGGSLWIDSSVEGHGTTICFTVPVADEILPEK